MNNKQLTFAREYRGYSQTQLASMIKGLSQSNLSNYEKGLYSLSEEVIERIIAVLKFPKSFFDLHVYNFVENPHYRKKSGITKRERSQIDYSDKLIGYIIDKMGESVDFPEFTLETFDIENGFTPEQVAQYTRKLFGIKEGPIDCIFKLLEQRGVIIVESIEDVDIFDGVSFITDEGKRVIIINKDFSNDHKRFTLAHELGHILLHMSSLVPDYRNKEAEANRFASEFLMPKSEIQQSLVNLKLNTLPILKRYWLTSFASIIHRAMDLGCINKDRYKYLNIELSRRGYRKDEPVMVSIDKPTSYKEAYRIHKTELGLSNGQIAESFSLPIDVINRFLKGNEMCVKVKKNIVI